MAFCRLHNEQWVVNLESLGLDALSKTETSKPCIISKHGLVVNRLNILQSQIVEWTFILTGAMGRIPVTVSLIKVHVWAYIRPNGPPKGYALLQVQQVGRLHNSSYNKHSLRQHTKM